MVDHFAGFCVHEPWRRGRRSGNAFELFLTELLQKLVGLFFVFGMDNLR